MKVLVLIIATDGHPYTMFEHFWRQYMSIDSTFECYFIKADSTIDKNYIDDSIVYIKCEENFNNIYYKTIETFKMFNIQSYDYIFRTNLSSFIVFNKYKNWLMTLPNKNVYNGSIKWFSRYPYASGCGFTCTPDVIEVFINSDQLNYVVDDVSFGKICLENSIKVSTAPLNEIYLDSMEDEIKKFDSYECAFHYRLKSINRSNDLSIYLKLINIYYKLDI